MEKKTKHFFCSFFSFHFVCCWFAFFLYSFFASILLFIAMELRERDTTAHVKNNLWELRIYCLYFFSSVSFFVGLSVFVMHMLLLHTDFSNCACFENIICRRIIFRGSKKRAVFSVVHIQFQRMLLEASFLQTSLKKPYDLLESKMSS